MDIQNGDFSKQKRFDQTNKQIEFHKKEVSDKKEKLNKLILEMQEISMGPDIFKVKS